MADKIVVDKFDVCYKFCDDHVRQCLNIDCQIAHNVSGDDFVNFYWLQQFFSKTNW